MHRTPTTSETKNPLSDVERMMRWRPGKQRPKDYRIYKRGVPLGEFFFDLLVELMVMDPRQLNRKYTRGSTAIKTNFSVFFFFFFYS